LIREGFGERFSFSSAVSPLSRPFQQKAGRWKRACQFSSLKKKIDLSPEYGPAEPNHQWRWSEFCCRPLVLALRGLGFKFQATIPRAKSALWWAIFQPHHQKENCVYCWPSFWLRLCTKQLGSKSARFVWQRAGLKTSPLALTSRDTSHRKRS